MYTSELSKYNVLLLSSVGTCGINHTLDPKSTKHEIKGTLFILRSLHPEQSFLFLIHEPCHFPILYFFRFRLWKGVKWSVSWLLVQWPCVCVFGAALRGSVVSGGGSRGAAEMWADMGQETGQHRPADLAESVQLRLVTYCTVHISATTKHTYETSEAFTWTHTCICVQT